MSTASGTDYWGAEAPTGQERDSQGSAWPGIFHGRILRSMWPNELPFGLLWLFVGHVILNSKMGPLRRHKYCMLTVLA